MTSYSLEGADAQAQFEKLKGAGALNGDGGQMSFTRTTKTTSSSDGGGGGGGGGGGVGGMDGGRTVTRSSTTSTGGGGGEMEITRYENIRL